MIAQPRIAQRLISGVIALSLVLAGLTAAPRVAAEAAILLDIAPIAQRFSPAVDKDVGTYDCLPASTTMALAYLQAHGVFGGARVTYVGVRKAYRAHVPGAGPLSPSLAPAVVAAISDNVVTATAAYRSGADWRSWLRGELAAGRPVLATIPDWRLLSPPGHATAEAGFTDRESHTVIVTGISDTDVSYDDPWDGNRWTLPAELFGIAWLDGGTQIVATWFTVGMVPVATPTPGTTTSPGASPAAPPTTSPPRSTPQTPPPAVLPGGRWIAPANDAIETGKFTVSVHAYPTHLADPSIDHVNVTLWWAALGPRSGPWTVACSISPPASGDTFTCSVDPASLGAPPGPLAISFDVYDQTGDRNLAPNGEHRLTWMPTPQATIPRSPSDVSLPGGPGNFLCEDPQSLPCELTWRDRSDNETAFQIYVIFNYFPTDPCSGQAERSTPPQRIASVPAGTQSWTLTRRLADGLFARFNAASMSLLVASSNHAGHSGLVNSPISNDTIIFQSVDCGG